MKPIVIYPILLLSLMIDVTAQVMDPETGLLFEYQAMRVSVAPVVDGHLDDPAWKSATPQKLEWDFTDNRLWRPSADFSGVFAGVWFDGFLYLAFEFADDQLRVKNNTITQQDRLEIYIDPERNGYKTNQTRYIIPVGHAGNQPPSPLILATWASNLKSVELSFNLRRIPKKGQKINFGFHYVDVDGGQQSNRRLGWAPKGGFEDGNKLADLTFAVTLKPTLNQKAMRWGRIKSLY